MSYDLNDAQPQLPPVSEPIPDGTFAKLRLTLRPGGVNGATPMDAGLLKASQSSDARTLASASRDGTVRSWTLETA